MYSDLIASIILFIGASYFYFFRIPKIKIMVSGSNSLLLPKLSLLLLMLFSIILGSKAILKKKKHKINKLEFNENIKKLIQSFILVLAYLYAVTIFGYFLSTPIFLILFIYMLGNRSLLINVIYSLILTIIIYGLFVKMLYIPLPLGKGIFKSFSEFLLY